MANTYLSHPLTVDPPARLQFITVFDQYGVATQQEIPERIFVGAGALGQDVNLSEFNNISMKLTTGAVIGNTTQAGRAMMNMPTSYGFKAGLYIPAATLKIRVHMGFRTEYFGLRNDLAIRLEFQAAAGPLVIAYLNSAGAYITMDTISYGFAGNPIWNEIKLLVDNFDQNFPKYRYFFFNRQPYDLTGIDGLTAVGSTFQPLVKSFIRAEATQAAAFQVNIGHWMQTTDEP